MRNLRIAGDPCNAFALLNNTLVAGMGAAQVDYERPVTPCTVTLAARLCIPGLPWEAVSATFPVAVVDVNEAPVVVVTVIDVVEGSDPGTLVARMEVVDPDDQVQPRLSLLITDAHVRADTGWGLCAQWHVLHSCRHGAMARVWADVRAPRGLCRQRAACS